MSDLKISQLPAAATLTGSELIELVQGGVNVQSTASAVASAAAPSQFGIMGNPNGPIPLGNSLANQFAWVSGFPSTPSGGAFNGQGSNLGSNNWTLSGTASTQQTNNGANLGASVAMGIYTSSAVANSAVDLYNTFFNPSNPTIPCARVWSNGLPIAGFTMTMYFKFSTSIATEQVFLGFTSFQGTMPGNQVPSALLNAIGIGMDNGDSSLAFYINNGAGSATKSALGAAVTPSSLNGHLLRLVITCDGLGNCTAALSDMETGGLTYSITYPTATAKLPAANTFVEPYIHINNGGTASAVALGVNSCFITAGFGL